MIIKILTTFPEMFVSFLSSSIIRRAISKKLVTVKLINLRDYTKDKHHRTDTPPVGGGAGLIMKCQPIYDALIANSNDDTLRIIMSPRGKTYNQKMAQDIVNNYKDIIILCGHYEGLDERIYKYFDLELSIGDYILTGGETASFVLIDSLSRLVDGVINKDSIVEETFSSHFVEYPQYTEPYEFNGDKIPDLLYCGNHEAIKKYNLKKSIEYTLKYRPDLLQDYSFNEEELSLLNEIKEQKIASWEQKAIEKGHKFIKKD